MTGTIRSAATPAVIAAALAAVIAPKDVHAASSARGVVAYYNAVGDCAGLPSTYTQAHTFAIAGAVLTIAGSGTDDTGPVFASGSFQATSPSGAERYAGSIQGSRVSGEFARQVPGHQQPCAWQFAVALDAPLDLPGAAAPPAAATAAAPPPTAAPPTPSAAPPPTQQPSSTALPVVRQALVAVRAPVKGSGLSVWALLAGMAAAGATAVALLARRSRRAPS